MSGGRYTVMWKRSAVETELAAAYLAVAEQGGDAGAITRAMAAADAAIAADPNNAGESRPAFERVAGSTR